MNETKGTTMRFKRYVLTALVAALIWPILLAIFQNPLWNLMQNWRLLAIVLMWQIFASTIIGVWAGDLAYSWTSGKIPLATWKQSFAYGLIALSATAVFCIWLSREISEMYKVHIGYVATFKSHGMAAFVSIFIAAVIIDLLVREYRHQ